MDSPVQVTRSCTEPTHAHTSAWLRSRTRLMVLLRWLSDSHHAACRTPRRCKGACSSSAVTSCSTFCHSSSVLRPWPQLPQASRTENKQTEKRSHETVGCCFITDTVPEGKPQAQTPCSKGGTGITGLAWSQQPRNQALREVNSDTLRGQQMIVGPQYKSSSEVS